MVISRMLYGALPALFFAVAAGAQSDEARDSEDEAGRDGGGNIEEIIFTGEQIGRASCRERV